MKKSVISSAVISVLGISAGTVNAAAVTGFTIKDVGSNTANGIGNFSSALDGISGAFMFKTSYINVQTYDNGNARPFRGDVGSGAILGGGAANPTGSFSTGLLFGTTPFVPYTFGGGFVADITSGALTVSTLDFGGNWVGYANFKLPPDNNFPVEVLWVNPTANPYDFNVAFRWGHEITTADDPSLMYTAFTGQWVLEGCMSTEGWVGFECGFSDPGRTPHPVPVPAPVWLFGSGLLGLAKAAIRRRKTA